MDFSLHPPASLYPVPALALPHLSIHPSPGYGYITRHHTSPALSKLKQPRGITRRVTPWRKSPSCHHILCIHGVIPWFTSNLHGPALLTKPIIIIFYAALTFILYRHHVIPFLSCLVPYPQLVVLAAHIPTLGIILYYIDPAKKVNLVSLTSDIPSK